MLNEIVMAEPKTFKAKEDTRSHMHRGKARGGPSKERPHGKVEKSPLRESACRTLILDM